MNVEFVGGCLADEGQGPVTYTKVTLLHPPTPRGFQLALAERMIGYLFWLLEIS
jgi:hypothetical protein